MLEVLIAGAGPAGAVAATILARAGVRVLLLDRATFPRDKLCGDTLNPGALAVLRRLGLAGVGEQRGLHLDGMIVTGEHGRRVEGRYPTGVYGCALARRVLDAALVERAVEAGARFEPGVLVKAPLVSHGRYGAEVRGVVVAGRDGRALRLPSRLTVAADGRRSTMAFALGLARHPAWPRRWAVGGYFEQVGGLLSLGEMHIRHDRYIGVAPLPGGLANACLVTSDRHGLENPARRLRAAIAAEPALDERFATARLAGPVATMGPLAVDAPAAGMPGLLLAGDAAGFVDPMTGDGMRFALRGAELAATTALEALRTGDLAHAHLHLLARRAEEFAGKQRFDRLLRAAAGSPAAVRLASLGATVTPALFRRLIAIAGDIGRP